MLQFTAPLGSNSATRKCRQLPTIWRHPQLWLPNHPGLACSQLCCCPQGMLLPRAVNPDSKEELQTWCPNLLVSAIKDALWAPIILNAKRGARKKGKMLRLRTKFKSPWASDVRARQGPQRTGDVGGWAQKICWGLASRPRALPSPVSHASPSPGAGRRDRGPADSLPFRSPAWAWPSLASGTAIRNSASHPLARRR